MFLAIRDGIVVERSHDEDTLLSLDPKIHDIIEWRGPLPSYDPELGEPMLDPRDTSQRDKDTKDSYKRQRKRAMPSHDEMLAMIYRDLKNRTTEYVDTVDAIHAQFPQPAQGGS